jgi:hypothetical protein
MENQTETLEYLEITGHDHLLDDDHYTFEFDPSAIPNFENNDSESDEEYGDREEIGDDDTDQDNNEEYTIDLPNVEESANLSECVIMLKDNGVMRRCNKFGSKNQRKISNLIGVWEVDKQAIEDMKKDNKLEQLGVCNSHFSLDHQTIHEIGFKQTKEHIKGRITSHRCIFCKKYYRVYLRGGECTNHCWSVLKKRTLIPCVGQHECLAIESFPTLVQKITERHRNSQRWQYICNNCYESQGGHLYQQPGRGRTIADNTCVAKGKHNDDKTESLKLFGSWLCNVVAKSDDDVFKDRVLTEAASLLRVFQKSEPTTIKPATLRPLVIRTILKTNNMLPESTPIIVTAENSYELGVNIGKCILNSRDQVKNNEDDLETPTSLDNYKNALPRIPTNIFHGIISTLYEKRQANERKIKLITIFLVSIILSTAFKNMKVWITRTLASVCQKPKLLPSLRTFLGAVNAISHTSIHERRLQRDRMQAANPIKRLQTGPFIWNVCVIDNIDLEESNYRYGNIYDTARKTFHATLRMVFQFRLPQSLSSIPDDKIRLTMEHYLFGENTQSEDWFQRVNDVFKSLVTSEDNVDLHIIHDKLIENVEIGCNVEKPNVVILEAGDKPSSNRNILETCTAYFDDFQMAMDDKLDIWADQAIHQRLIKAKNYHEKLRVGLGQWHTSKSMCNALVLIFSSYGIYNLASELGVMFLEKLEKNSDYRSTCNVLEMIWASTGIAIHKYLTQKGLTLANLINGNNELVKVWLLYFKWASFWKGHKIGIRRANFDMQFSNLAAFSPLFPTAARRNYAKAVVHFLAELASSPQLQELLKIVCSVNLTKKGHYFAFDEALEFFGVKYVKQNIKKVISEDDLKLQIKAVQAERAVTDFLFSTFNGDHVSAGGSHAKKSRSEAINQLAEKMLEAFISRSPAEHWLFRGCSQLTETGYERIFNCYQSGVERLTKYYKQAILRTERDDPTGRAAAGVVITKVQDLAWNSEAYQKIRREVSNIRANVEVDVDVPMVMDVDRTVTPPPLYVPDPDTPRSEYGKRRYKGPH